jgi:nucleotide-binding universal stress UspA family protein
MGRILCATRGGEDSQHTQQAAIALAKERDDELVFIYVADTSFLSQIAAPVLVDVEAELDQMGRFQLAIAQEQAAEQGVNAQVTIRHGRLRTELILAARDLRATLIILGRPRGRLAVFDEADLQLLAADLKLQTGAEVRVL